MSRSIESTSLEDVGEKVQPFLCEYENHSRAASASSSILIGKGKRRHLNFLGIT